MPQAQDPSAEPSSDVDGRPAYRVALFGMTERYHRLLEVVFRHALNNRYRFVLAATRTPGDFDLALVDVMSTNGAKLAQTLTRVIDAQAVLTVGRRIAAVDRPADHVLAERFIAQVLFALNAAVERTSTEEVSQARRVDPAMVVSDFGLLRRPRVLVVDDSATVRRQVVGALENMGIDAEEAATAQQALAQVNIRPYEMVLADVVMPEMDGYQMTRAIKKNRALRGLPIVMLTSKSSPFDRARAALAGCNSFLVKPVTIQALRETVYKQLRRAARR